MNTLTLNNMNDGFPFVYKLGVSKGVFPLEITPDYYLS